MELPFDRFLNKVYYFAIENADPKDRVRFDVRLNMPDVKAVKAGKAITAGPWSPEAETAALGSLAAQLTGVMS